MGLVRVRDSGVGLGFRSWGRAEGLGFRAEGLGLRAEGLGLRVQGLGLTVWGVLGLGLRVYSAQSCRG